MVLVDCLTLWLSNLMAADRDIEALRERLADPATFEEELLQFAEDLVQSIGDEVDVLEQEIRSEVPSARHIDIEQD